MGMTTIVVTTMQMMRVGTAAALVSNARTRDPYDRPRERSASGVQGCRGVQNSRRDLNDRLSDARLVPIRSRRQDVAHERGAAPCASASDDQE
jgi:hypothetical protein